MSDIIPMPDEDRPIARRSIDADELISKAIDSRAPVESLERLLAMRKEIMADQAREEYFAAMADFQSECPIVGKTRDVRLTGGGYRFAPMEDIKPKVDPFIRRHGFSYRWDVRENEVACIITHRGGHSEESKFPLKSAKAPAMNEVQGLASGQSYAKRYAFINGFGIVVGDEDDDGRRAEAKPITDEQAIQIGEMIEAYGIDHDKFLAWVSKSAGAEVTNVDEIPATMLDKAMEALRARAPKGGSK